MGDVGADIIGEAGGRRKTIFDFIFSHPACGHDLREIGARTAKNDVSDGGEGCEGDGAVSGK
ncbi:MAG: hypothetical protein LUF92_16720 [Clostridiales bacterium]|nr:hypothetical protein [Clostridiales bacterium]